MARRSLKGRKCRKGGSSKKKTKRSQKRGGMIRALTNMYRAYRYPDTVPDKEYPNGDIYIGALENDLPNGQGKMTYANRDIYEGNWENGQRSGHGIMKNAVFKQEYEGDWVNGELHQGIIRWLHNNYFKKSVPQTTRWKMRNLWVENSKIKHRYLYTKLMM